MPTVNDFRDLIVWQRSDDFIVEVYKLSRKLPDDERFLMTSQLRSAALSVSSNIA
jgi:four helix bundle protein